MCRSLRLLPFVFLSLQSPLHAASKPNVIVIIADDQGWGDVGVHGNKNLRTPHLDALANSGARFDRFYVAPVCAPTRASLLTGRHHRVTGVRGVTRGEERMNLDEVTVADAFREAGYRTAAFGKWHNGSVYPYHPNGRGFEEFFGFCCGHWGNYFDPLLEHNGEPVQAKGFIADVFTDKAIGYIEKKALRDEPFFCWLAYCTPHSPFQVADRDWVEVADREITMKNRDPEKEDETPTRAALALVENIDRNVGRIVERLDTLLIRRDTIVVYLSDNGPNTWRWNGGMKGKKGSVDEGGVRVPFFLSWPGMVEPAVIDYPAAHIDLLPTLCELCEVPKPAGKPLHGLSLRPLLLHEEVEWPERPLYSAWRGRFSVRAGKYRHGPGFSFDLEADPEQRVNLIKELPAGERRRAQDLLAGFEEKYPLAERSEDSPVGYREFPLTTLNAQDAQLAEGLKFSSVHPNASWIQDWTKEGTGPAWKVDVLTAGNYEVRLLYSCGQDAVGTKLRLGLGEATLDTELKEAHDPPLFEHRDRVKRSESYDKSFKVHRAGMMRLPAGKGEFKVTATSKPGAEVMDLRAVVLELK